ncbi:MAG: antitoxin component HigA of HigAB toxin-antitoxin module [Cryomorphaceae bacterium]|jgi:antitoxin component HigA of HigAB toxin-antitoxin module
MQQLINSETEYQDALEQLEVLMLANPEEGSAEADELELLVYLIASYERHTLERITNH